VGTFSIASPTTADSLQCAELLVTQLAEHDVNVTTEDLTPILNRVIDDPKLGFLFVARAEDRIIGVAYAATLLSAEHCGFISSLEELYVAPDWRQKGVGTALLSAVFERAAKEGLVAIELEIDAGHRQVESLYKRFGFRRLDRSRWLIDLPPKFGKK
jgi:GNAT superfamily N-acetyltransferase